MTPEIIELIKKKAKDYAQFRVKGPTTWTDRWPKKEQGYYDGQIEAIEMMIGFDNWLHLNYEPVEQDNYQGLYEEREKPFAEPYTRIELLTKYLTEVLSKPDNQKV